MYKEHKNVLKKEKNKEFIMKSQTKEKEIRPWVKELFKKQPPKQIVRKYQFPSRKIQYQALIIQLDKLNKNSTNPQN